MTCAAGLGRSISCSSTPQINWVNSRAASPRLCSARCRRPRSAASRRLPSRCSGCDCSRNCGTSRSWSKSRPMKIKASLVATLGLIAFGKPAQAASTWPDTYRDRLAAWALLETLNANLLASNSATKTLEIWCGAHHMAAQVKLHARLRRDVRQARYAGTARAPRHRRE